MDLPKERRCYPPRELAGWIPDGISSVILPNTDDSKTASFCIERRQLNNDWCLKDELLHLCS